VTAELRARVRELTLPLLCLVFDHKVERWWRPRCARLLRVGRCVRCRRAVTRLDGGLAQVHGKPLP
jgi:hypothetical protein